MKTILLYGDSNTWGQNAQSGRYQYEVRWSSQLQSLLGDRYEVYSAGLSGRAAGDHDVIPTLKQGKRSFEVVYRQVFPIEVAVIALGTNDIKRKYDLSVKTIFNDLEWYAEQLSTLRAYDDSPLSPAVVFLLPPNFDTDKFGGDEMKRQEIIAMMERKNYQVIAADDIEMSSDGVHFSEKGHTQIAHLVHKKLMEMQV